MVRRAIFGVVCAWIAIALAAQTSPQRSVMGKVTAFRPEALEMDVKTNSGDAVPVVFTAETIVLKVAPGAKDLKGAAPAKVTDIALDDQVLVSFAADGKQARRIVVMPAAEIKKHDEADTQDWVKRGVAGVVAAKHGNLVTLKMRSFTGETQATVTIAENTKFRRYAPDSVRFRDARPSSLAEVNVGDQLRARGQKSEDGLKVDAEEIVFGTFLTKAGTITAIDPAGQRITVKDLVSAKPLTIQLTADSQLRMFPDMAAMFASRGGQGGPGAGTGPGGMGGGMPGGAGRPAFDIGQMLERMPPTKLENLKPGQTIIVSSTKGEAANQVTAITLLANADFLIQMASRAGSAAGNRGGGQTGGMGMGMGSMGMSGLAGGLEGLGMPGMIP